MAARFALCFLLVRGMLLGGLTVGASGCEKEEERRCGMGHSSAHMRFQVVDARSGISWPN